MFTAAIDWVGLLVAGAAVALRIYLRESEMGEESEFEVWERQWKADRERVRAWLWETRSMQLDALLMHTCGVQEDVRALLRLAGLEPEQWILGALANERGVAEHVEA